MKQIQLREKQENMRVRNNPRYHPSPRVDRPQRHEVRRNLTSSEKKVYDILTTNLDASILRGGWPDFVVCFKGRKPVFVEVKNGIDKLTQRQLEMHNFLKSIGLKVVVVHSDSNTLRSDLLNL